MWQGLLCALLVSVLCALYSVNRFSNILNNPPILSLVLLLALCIPFSSVFFLAIDLVSSTVAEDSASDNSGSNFFYVPSKKLVFNLWRVNYWLGFSLTWFLLPLCQCYYSSNNFLFKKRVWDSVVYNLKFYLAYLVAGLLGLVYVYFSVGLSYSSIKALVIILSHSYSLILAIWFMGYGLINLPKSLLWNSLVIRLNERRLVDHYYLRILHAKEDYHDARANYKQVVSLIYNLNAIHDLQHNQYHRQWIEYLYNSMANLVNYKNRNNHGNGSAAAPSANYSQNGPVNLQSNLINYNNRFNQDLVLVNNQLSDAFLLTVTKNFKDSFYNLLIKENNYYNLLKKVIKIQDIRASKSLHSVVFRAPNKNHSRFSVNYFVNNVIFKSSRSKFWYYYYLNPFALKIFVLLLLVLSLFIIASEIFHNSKFSLINIFIFNVFINHAYVTTALILIFMSYMCFASLISLSKTKVFLVYKLINKNSNPSSCLWYSSYAIRLTIPLAYNFLTLLNKQILSNNKEGANASAIAASATSAAAAAAASGSKYQRAQLAVFLGDSINLIGVGQTINNILPYFILIPIFIQLLSSNKKNRIINNAKKRFYLDDLDFLLWDTESDSDNENDDEDYRDGDDDLERGNSLASRYRDNSSSNSSSGTFLNSGNSNSADPSRARAQARKERKLDWLTKQVERLIDQELSNPESLLNTYDDNYGLFYDMSMRKYVKLLFNVFFLFNKRKGVIGTGGVALASDELGGGVGVGVGADARVFGDYDDDATVLEDSDDDYESNNGSRGGFSDFDNNVNDSSVWTR